ncbi:MAG: hypothetical protein LQ348_004869 [Seirophora lacunosa]|nr:MAG: hypothetical protein LQ348_004869 [Seirophora lacunosa]
MYQTPARYGTEPNTGKDAYLTWTFRQLDKKADDLAASLAFRGICSGMRLVVFLPNSAELALLLWASIKLGTTFVPLDERAVSRQDQVDHFLRVLKPSALFVSGATHARTLLENHPQEMGTIAVKAITEPKLSHVDGWQNLEEFLVKGALYHGLEATRQGDLERHVATDEPPKISNIIGCGEECNGQKESDLGSILYIVFTSGISGLPKACPTSNRNFWACAVAGEGSGVDGHTDVMALITPPSHSMGISGILRTWLKGATVVISSPAFDARMTIEAIDKLKCTHTNAIPTMILALLKQPTFHPQKTRSLRRVALGGTIISPGIVAAATDPNLLSASEATAGYGMSEGLPICRSSSKQDMKVDRGAVSLGRALPGVRVRVCQHGSRRVLTRGEVGELHFSGGMVIAGYLFGDNHCFYDDESGHWIATGDEAMMDREGNIFIFGRYKDIIIRGGENLSPALIENCLSKAGVLGQIIGIPDEIAGEVPLAVMQVPDQGQIPKAKILDLVMESLGPTCLPTAYITLTELGMVSFPLTTSGKVRKSELREAALEYLAGRTIQDRSGSVTGTGAHPVSSAETLLKKIVAELIGVSGESISPDQRMSTMLDSISTLRLQAKIEQATGHKVSIEVLLGEATINTLAGYADDRTPVADTSLAPAKRQRGPPTATDMVHTHEDKRRETRTRAQAELLLAKHGMSWEDVEDVFPIPGLAGQYCFDAMRPLSFSVRATWLIWPTNNAAVLRAALETTLEKWSMFRSLAMRIDDTALFVIPRACGAVSQMSIFELPDVEDPEQMRRLWFPNVDDNNVHVSGGRTLARFGITRVRSTGCTGLMMLAHHVLFDAISLRCFIQDLAANISGDHPVREPWTDYKLFADTFYQNRTSIPAQTSVAFHVNRLRGIGSLREVIWPPQRCIGAFIGDDTGYRIPPALRDPLLLDRSQIDDDAGYTGLTGIRKTVDLGDDLVKLRAEHGITTPVLFKLACAILNSRLSGSPDVFFAQSQSGRQWPFVDESIARYLPNPITIAGSTLALIMNRIHVDADASVGTLLTHLEEEQRLLSKHAHASLPAISAQLNNAADVAALIAGRKQVLNWNPAMAERTASEKRESSASSAVQLLKTQGFSDGMLHWHCGLVGSHAVLKATWDGAQFAKATVDPWTDMFLSALKWVAATANWDRKLGELELM